MKRKNISKFQNELTELVFASLFLLFAILGVMGLVPENNPIILCGLGMVAGIQIARITISILLKNSPYSTETPMADESEFDDDQLQAAIETLQAEQDRRNTNTGA